MRASDVETRGKGGFVRASWDKATEIVSAANADTAKTYGPDRVFAVSPIPAMSMISDAAGTYFLSLLGGPCMSFYDWNCDRPPASPTTWGAQTDGPESADLCNAAYPLLRGSNVPQTRTPGAHFSTEARHPGTPAWAEKFTRVPANKIVHVTREFAQNPEKTNGNRRSSSARR